jgi:hypothetical protein
VVTKQLTVAANFWLVARPGPPSSALPIMAFTAERRAVTADSLSEAFDRR